ncbi:hypothetical protein [Clostridium sp. CF012]|uniref:hypothetical protein n=1 Tax=Clostridium sp. CF012 TaxID=2843319 RepID=UPI001C0D372C|nr:hypothetical protein [Clostridium sp. CF012]MBU3145977.1 hypothetical protein [Clostridium sp. CF012]
MPAISKIRFTNVVYENGDKRYNDDIFQFDGQNAAILLENGGGKTVFVQTALQAIIPHIEVADRKIKNTLMLENSAAHIAIEWILNEHPRRYAVTAVTLFINKGNVDSHKYVYEYDEDDDNSIDKIPFVKETSNGNNRPATKEEMGEYYYDMNQNRMNAHTFSTIKNYHEYIEDNFKIIPSEWRKIALINGAEGDVEAFFDACQTTNQLIDNLLIPVVEEALAGNGTKEFIDTFEKQREHFKKHKQLRTRIEESKKVEQQIMKYVNVFDVFEQANKKIVNAREEAKAIYNFTKRESIVNGREIIENQNSLIKQETELELCNQKQASYKLAVLDRQVVIAEKAFNEANNEYAQAENVFEEKNGRLNNLKVAKLKKDIKERKEKIEYLTEQIDLLDKEEDIIDLKEELLQNSSELRGYYQEQEQKLIKQQNVINSQIETHKDELKARETEKEVVREDEEKLKHNETRIKTEIDNSEKNMKKITNEILANPLQEKIEEENVKWKGRLEQLEKNIFDYDQKLKKSWAQKQDLIGEIDISRCQLNKSTKQETIMDGEINSIREKHDILLNRIKVIKNNRNYSDSLYSKQESILQQLELRIENLRSDREKLLLKERLAHRYLDEYKYSEYYTGEPLIENWIKSWGNSFKYIESGTKYIQRVAKGIEKTEADLYKINPYWSVTIIVFDTEIEKLRERVYKNNNEISTPIFIMTEKEALGSIKGEIVEDSRTIFPLLWQDNISQKLFESWKSEIEFKANEVTETRDLKEREYSIWTDLLRDVREFYENYPYDEYVELQKRFKEIKENNFNISKEINAKEEVIKQIDKGTIKYQKMETDDREEKYVLENKVIRAQDYISSRDESLKWRLEINKVKEFLLLYKEKISRCDIKINDSTRVLNEMLEDLRENKYNIRQLIADVIFQEVKSSAPRYTTVSKVILITRRKDLKDAIDKKQKGREVLESKLNDAQSGISGLEYDLNNLRLEVDFELNEELEFPLYGGDEIDKLIESIGNLKEPLKTLERALVKIEKNYNDKKAVYTLRKGDFYKKYKEILIFTVTLAEVEIQLNKEKLEFGQQKEYLTNRKNQLSTVMDDITRTINELNIQNGKFAYLSEEIKEITLTEDVKASLPYQRKEFVSKIKDELQNLNEVLVIQSSKVEMEQQGFIKFCDSEINDIKLKEMAVTGIQHKKLFRDILEWQQRMNERIARTIEIAENDIRDHDKEVQQFISHLHSYLRTMAEELRTIPKKTRIKVQDQWKDIFLINVPEWDEKEGKEELSNHIDWILKQLESDQYKDENGVEVEASVRKAIEKWMKSKQLLQNIMKQNSIKVKCRKVTNDGNVSSSPFTWEVSNSWSGGEKWSKNMTLFLGILNYLAEKRKNIVSTAKRYRTVIVDNPFGKASSDHVLDPVFFIAEQLGFQIIALTAHSEGKFIRTYFPIVYSCRLKAAENSSNVQILLKEREIRKAFFRDSDPQTLQRLGQLKQMDIFDYNPSLNLGNSEKERSGNK